MKKLLKNPLFYVMYFIPQLIMTHAVSTFNKTFSNGQACFADYYLHFYDWDSYDFLCMYEVIYVSFFMVMLVRRELMSNRVVLYESTTKLWVNTIKSSALFTIIFPVMNCVIIGIVAAMKNAVFTCNWSKAGSMAATIIPYYELHEINTFIVAGLSVFLDVIRLQVTLFIVCIASWLVRKTIVVFLVVYINIIIVNIQPLLAYCDMNVKSIYNYMIVSKMGTYLKGISVFDNVVLPVIIWAVCVTASFLVFRFYRKDMLKN